MRILAFIACSPPGDPPAKDLEGGCYLDADSDGFGASPSACDGHAATVDGDCDDDDPDRNPAVPEVCGGGDEDCSGAVDDEPVDGLELFEDADGDGFGNPGAPTTGCGESEHASLDGDDCDDGDGDVFPGAPEQACGGVDRNCDGLAATVGDAPECAVAACADLPDLSGVAWVTFGSTPAPVWCERGWTLGFVRNTSSTGNQAAFGGPGGLDREALAIHPADASTSVEPVLGWQDLELGPWTELMVASYRAGSERYRSRRIPRSDLRIPFGVDGARLWGESGYFWCGGSPTYTDDGIGAVDNPPLAPADCKGHNLLGSGWDFSESPGYNNGLTLCGADGSNFLYASWGADPIGYGAPGGAQAIWVR